MNNTTSPPKKAVLAKKLMNGQLTEKPPVFQSGTDGTSRKGNTKTHKESGKTLDGGEGSAKTEHKSVPKKQSYSDVVGSKKTQTSGRIPPEQWAKMSHEERQEFLASRKGAPKKQYEPKAQSQSTNMDQNNMFELFTKFNQFMSMFGGNQKT
jgi:hypothetical protein